MSRTKQEWENIHRMITALQDAGITYQDAWSLRRISMALRRWHELECGNSNNYASWVIVRGHKAPGSKLPDGTRVAGEFTHADDGDSYEERHIYNHGTATKTIYTKIPDRERGAKRRLAKIMEKYPSLKTYIQGDPRGCALHVLRPGDVPEGEDPSCYYTRGIAIY